MSRFTAADIDRLNIPKARKKALLAESRAQASRHQAKLREAAASQGVAAPPARGGTDTYQRILYEALVERLGQNNVLWEAEGLIPGRKFRVDIFLPPAVLVEFDGYQFHRSKDAYQKDRVRQNLFVRHGYLPLRYFAKQITDPVLLAGVVEEVAAVWEANQV